MPNQLLPFTGFPYPTIPDTLTIYGRVGGNYKVGDLLVVGLRHGETRVPVGHSPIVRIEEKDGLPVYNPFNIV